MNKFNVYGSENKFEIFLFRISGTAALHGKSLAHVILRWNLQKGVVVIPGSSNSDHIKENTEIFDFELGK